MTEVLQAHDRADVVVWDDLGAERPTEWTLDRIYLLLDARYEAEKPLLATTNLSMTELETNLRARITSRLLAMGPVWDVPGADYRLQQAKARLRRPS
jgi:DNA replication protein DnaC